MLNASYWGRALPKNISFFKIVNLFAASLIFEFSLISVSCTKQSSTEQLNPPLYFHSKASIFGSNNRPSLGGAIAIENSLVSFQGQTLAFFDEGPAGDLTSANIGSDGSVFSNKRLIEKYDHRFSYVFNYQNVLYDFYNKGGEIYLDKSLDGINWQLINNGQPVLNTESDSNSIYHFIWNVGVAVDDNGIWQMLIESSDSRGNYFAGLSYSTATMNNDSIDFNINKSSNFVTNKAGNPFLQNIPGKGLLVFYGKQDERNLWFITAGILVNGTFTEHLEFMIGAPGIHVCDPAALQLADGSTLLSLSFNQDSTYMAYSDMSLEQIFDSLNISE